MIKRIAAYFLKKKNRLSVSLFYLEIVLSISIVGFPRKHRQNDRRFYEEGAHQFL